jgi:hypothetical protein
MGLFSVTPGENPFAWRVKWAGFAAIFEILWDQATNEDEKAGQIENIYK